MIKIGQYLAKIWTKVWWHVFFSVDHGIQKAVIVRTDAVSLTLETNINNVVLTVEKRRRSNINEHMKTLDSLLPRK